MTFLTRLSETKVVIAEEDGDSVKDKVSTEKVHCTSNAKILNMYKKTDDCDKP